jgi:hypothetical protein
VNPGLQMARAGLQHHTGIMAVGPHAVDNSGGDNVQVDQNVPGTLMVGIRLDVDVTSFAVANAGKILPSPHSTVGQPSKAVLHGAVAWWRGE